MLLLLSVLFFLTAGSSAQQDEVATVTIPPRPNIGSCAVDVCFLVDESGSIRLKNWITYVIPFLTNIVESLQSSKFDVYAGIVTFGDDAECDLPMTADLNVVLATINGDMSNYDGPPGTSTNMAAGLRKCREEVFGHPADRPGVKNMVVLLSDGIPNDIDEAIAEANLLKSGPSPPSPVKIVTVGVLGFLYEYAIEILNAISSDGTTYGVLPWNELPTLLEGVIQEICPPCSACDGSFMDEHKKDPEWTEWTPTMLFNDPNIG